MNDIKLDKEIWPTANAKTGVGTFKALYPGKP